MPLNDDDRFSIFDDKGAVKALIDFVIQQKDPEVKIEHMRKIDFTYIFTLSKRDRSKEVELSRAEINASWNWRGGTTDETLRKKIEDTIAQL